MSVANSIPHAIVNVAAGLMVGTAIELVIPAPSSSDSASQLGFEVVLQAALNGLAIAAVVPMLDPGKDLTYGIPFYAALYASQGTFAARLESASALAKYHSSQFAQRMGLPVSGVGRPTEDPLQS